MSQEINQPKELPQESWNNAPQPKPFTEQTKHFVQQFVSDVSSSIGSEDLNFQTGDSIELTFYMDDPETGMRTKSMPKWNKTGEMIKDENGKIVKEDQVKPNFVVYNHRDQVKQNWWVSSRWALLAAQTMMEYNTDTLQVKRLGKKQDTVYTFVPTGFKRASV